MRSVRYAIYLCIMLHFLRRCLRKSLTQVKKPKKADLPEWWNDPKVNKALYPSQKEFQDDIDREILAEMAMVAKSGHSLSSINTAFMAWSIRKAFAEHVSDGLKKRADNVNSDIISIEHSREPDGVYRVDVKLSQKRSADHIDVRINV